jgi:hypothetical protein
MFSSDDFLKLGQTALTSQFFSLEHLVCLLEAEKPELLASLCSWRIQISKQ